MIDLLSPLYALLRLNHSFCELFQLETLNGQMVRVINESLIQMTISRKEEIQIQIHEITSQGSKTS